MDRRSWPWKKKSSEKAVATSDSANALLSGSGGNQADQDDSKAVKYVQISAESYGRLTELEDEVKVLNEKVSSAQAEMTSKDNIVKQHAKVAEEAVSGWEKAEAEALALKQQLESVTLLKLTAEEKASHLDGALKECMKQIRNVKEESEQKLHDVVFAKTKQWEKVKLEFETKIVNFEREILRASSENAALSRSLQERTNMLMKISDEKSQAEAEIEVLKSNLQSCEKEISSLKYELHIISKELEIRNEEKNMSMRSAEVANKQHVEDVKKITKLEAECQRLRGLVRKKLPGPAALAQMKLEVENLGREYGETKLRRSPAKNSSPHLVPVPDFAFESIQQFQKENEFLTARLLATEEETKMLKEALSKRNTELQTSRNICAKTTSKLRSLEAHMLVWNQHKSTMASNISIPFEGSLILNESNPPSLTSMSEDGVDEEGSCADSWAAALMSELSQFKKNKDVDKGNKAADSNHLELMDDFLEMERLACMSTETNVTITVSNGAVDKMGNENDSATSVIGIQKDGTKEEHKELAQPVNPVSSIQAQHDQGPVSDRTSIQLTKLRSRIVSLFQPEAQETDMRRLLEDIRHILQDTMDELPQNSIGCVCVKGHSIDATSDQKHFSEEIGESTNAESVKQGGNLLTDDKNAVDEDLKIAVSHIYDFVLSLGKKAMEIQSRILDERDLRKRFEDFSGSVNKVLYGETTLNDFIVSLSQILSITSELNCNMLHDKVNEGESNGSDCVDKLALLENKVAQHDSVKETFGFCTLVSHSASDPEIEGPIGPGYDLMTTSPKFSSEEFEQLKLDKENIEVNLVKCTETLEHTKHKLVETEKQLEELKVQLSACHKSNSLASTQLKCMAESYKLLETRAHELESEIGQLRTKAEMLDNELQEERRSHQDDLAKYNDLQAQIERNEKCSACSIPSESDADIKTKQEREIAAAAEKLVECQETILLLGRQLQALRPPAEPVGSSPDNRNKLSDHFLKDAAQSGLNTQGMLTTQQLDQAEMENTASSATQGAEDESPLDGYNSHMSPSDTESSNFQRSPISLKRQKHRSSGSSYSSSMSHGRGFSRFFSKGKGNY